MTDRVVTGDLSVDGNTDLSGGVFLDRFSRLGDTTVAGAFTVLFNTAAADTVTVAGSVVLDDKLTADQAFHGPATVQGVVVAPGVTASGAVTAEALSTAGAVTVDGALSGEDWSVAGALVAGTVSGGVLKAGEAGLAVSGTCDVGGQLAVSGADSDQGTLTVADDFLAAGTPTPMTTLQVTNALVVAGDLEEPDELSANVALAAAGASGKSLTCDTLCFGGPYGTVAGTVPRITYAIQLVQGSGSLTGISLLPGSTDSAGAFAISATGTIFSPPDLFQFSTVGFTFRNPWPSTPKVYVEMEPEDDPSLNYVRWTPNFMTTTTFNVRLATNDRLNFPAGGGTRLLRYWCMLAS